MRTISLYADDTVTYVQTSGTKWVDANLPESASVFINNTDT